MAATLPPSTAHDNSIIVSSVSRSQGNELIADTALGEVIALCSFFLSLAHFFPLLCEA